MTDLPLVVSARVPVAEGVVELTLTSPDPLPAWEPGAHIDLVLRPGVVRQYSLMGTPTAWTISVLLEPSGRGGSSFVHNELPVGTRVAARGPRNHFRLDDADSYLFIAGGIGITPLRSMIASVAARDASWRLVYGGRTRASMAYADELVSRYGDRVTVWPQDSHGLIDLPSLLSTPSPDTLVYCCGPEPLLRAVEEHCAVWPPDTLHVERFTAAAASLTPSGSFEVELVRSGLTVFVPADQTILAAVEAAGVPVDFSCLEGSCGTCETKVLAGEVDHRDVVLSASERAANKTMMICSSRALSPRLVLDL